MTACPASVAPGLFPKQSLARIFYAASRKETLALGRTFAQAVIGMQNLSREQRRVFRVGFRAIGGRGKTTFARGVLSGLHNSGFPIRHVLERMDGIRPQRTILLKEGGCVRWYDALVVEDGLSSYRNNTIPWSGFPFVDLVEHPDHDYYNKDFDCLVHLEEGPVVGSPERHIEIHPVPEVFETSGFQRFLDDAQTFAAPLTAGPL